MSTNTGTSSNVFGLDVSRNSILKAKESIQGDILSKETKINEIQNRTYGKVHTTKRSMFAFYKFIKYCLIFTILFALIGTIFFKVDSPSSLQIMLFVILPSALGTYMAWQSKSKESEGKEAVKLSEELPALKEKYKEILSLEVELSDWQNKFSEISNGQTNLIYVEDVDKTRCIILDDKSVMLHTPIVNKFEYPGGAIDFVSSFTSLHIPGHLITTSEIDELLLETTATDTTTTSKSTKSKGSTIGYGLIGGALGGAEGMKIGSFMGALHAKTNTNTTSRSTSTKDYKVQALRLKIKTKKLDMPIMDILLYSGGNSIYDQQYIELKQQAERLSAYISALAATA